MSNTAKRKYLCPRHKEETPSAVVYDDHFHCFGCGARGPASELGVDYTVEPELPPEDLAARFRYINSLPVGKIRGLDLPYDNRGYYVTWPDGSYYKQRVTDPAGKGRYLGPRGHKPPLFVAGYAPFRGHPDPVFVVEGELNALSIATVCPGLNVVSPGSAGNFSTKGGNSILRYVRDFETIYLIVDRDAPGVKGAIELKSALLAAGCPSVAVEAWPVDANDILTQEGPDALRKKVQEALGMRI